MKLRRVASVLGITVAMVSGSALGASAITGGALDGDGHPNVGIIGYYDATGRMRCTATLVSPTVLVTAGHCTQGSLGKTAVRFDPVIAEQAPSPLPPAADPSVGYTSDELAAAGWLSGTAYTHPGFSNFTDKANWNDVGVIVLDQAVATIEPAVIAPLGYLDQFTPDVLGKTLFTAVGYGTESVKPPSGPQKPTPMSFPIVRRVADEPGQKLTDQILQVNGNDKDPRGTGGTCFGDSGGPAFNGGYQVTVTSYGNSNVCRYIDGFQRLDIPVVQDWLATFGVTPAAG
jgi:Trypsin